MLYLFLPHACPECSSRNRPRPSILSHSRSSAGLMTAGEKHEAASPASSNSTRPIVTHLQCGSSPLQRRGKVSIAPSPLVQSDIQREAPGNLRGIPGSPWTSPLLLNTYNLDAPPVSVLLGDCPRYADTGLETPRSLQSISFYLRTFQRTLEVTVIRRWRRRRRPVGPRHV